MKHPHLSSLFSSLLLTAVLSVPSAFAQGVFEGSGEVADPNCIGDGCGYVSSDDVADESASSSDTSSENAPSEFTSSEYVSSENTPSEYDGSGSEESTDAPDSLGATTEMAESNAEEQDSTASESDSSSTNQVANADPVEKEDADSEYESEDDEDDDRPSYIVESNDEYRARKEGFSRGIQFGIRVGGGINHSFGSKSSDWKVGGEGVGGLMARVFLGRSLGLATELDFTYRHYSLDSKNHYGKNEATIDEMLFMIPIMGQYIHDEDGLFFSFGFNLSLKMSGDSELEQTIDAEGFNDKDKRSNTIPTSGVEIGGLLGVGYLINHWLMADLRIIQNITNTLDLNLMQESTLMNTKLFTTHIMVGVTLLL